MVSVAWFSEGVAACRSSVVNSASVAFVVSSVVQPLFEYAL